ncbi:hypothetical protein L1987_34951 [Smallanthus sonchifolius]|uniref:Uncharacterized protein n=1 Tax=Smallanthus sonchifolius TaxID=185202 RepID=A0ACB9HVN8_9ASTR|nr:hypothetical protein L1987_34951 [Smallanthus sonchifolius]
MSSPLISSTVHWHSVTPLLRPRSPSLSGLSSRNQHTKERLTKPNRQLFFSFQEHNKKREDLQRFEELKKKGAISDSEDDDESSDDDDEEDIVNYSTKHDLKFFDALIKVKNKDPSLKNNDAKLFNSDDEQDVENEGADDKKEKKTKSMFLTDANAKHLMENGAEFDENI